MLAGFLGSLIVFAPYTPFANILTSPISKGLVSIIMVLVAYGYKRLRYFLSNLAMFYLTTFCAGGALIGLHYFVKFDLSLHQSVLISSIKGFGDPISWIFVILGFPLALMFSKGTFNQFEIAKYRFDQIYDVTISINNSCMQLKGLVDSGNLLYDPISNKPVMIVSIHKVKHFFPEALLKVFENANELGGLAEDLNEWISRITIIPYKVIGQDNKLIASIKPDQITIKDGEDLIETSKVLVAFVNQTLSSDDSFDCIIHPKLMTKANIKQVS